MAVYAIGDVQGCWRELKALLKKLRFRDSDELWLAGDLINRGPDSLKVLRKLRAMDQQIHIVLGNHDLHFLAIVFGGHLCRAAGR
jgi:bis(5'-nucleosyl)-tetraphosphatase (symmetrical)